MQIVIKLSDKTYKDIKEENGIYGTDYGLSTRITGKVVGAIQSGTPLPEETIKALEQQKTGHWTGKKQIAPGEWKDYIVPLKDGYVTGSCSCSECGEWLTASDEYACYGNYCPNCGAKMEREGVNE